MLNISVPEELLEQLLPHRQRLVDLKVASRIAAKDFTIWGKEAEAESSIRLGWVGSATDSQKLVSEILQLKQELNSKGITRIVLCGMGGSSLAPEVITKTYGVELEVLDSTNPDHVRKVVYKDLEKTAVVVSSKSGSTVETDSQKRIFEEAFSRAGIDKAERIFIVTDPQSPMEQAARADGYRVFNADPTVGGRYSALTAFGLVPSGLAGVNVQDLLDDALAAGEILGVDETNNEAVILGAAMARSASRNGFRDKLGLISDADTLPDFADWAEQLIAESTGKHDKGVLPVVLSESSPEVQLELDDMVLVAVSESEAFSSQAPILVSGSIGEQFLLWEYATAIASALLEINPFDQPDVESAKVAARGMLQQKGQAVAVEFTEDGIGVNYSGFTSADIKTVLASLDKFLAEAGENSYIAIQAYLDRLEGIALEDLREAIVSAISRPVTVGWGPRFLHSTGQYHKGGPKTGIYLQLITKAQEDVAVPGRDFSFGELIASQSAGDAKVLSDLGRPVLTLTLSDPVEDVKKLTRMLMERK